MDDLISRQAAIECLEHLSACDEPFVEIGTDDETFIGKYEAITEISDLPPAQPESARTFVELVVKYPDPELCTYKEYKGYPYYSIKYIENGETYVGYSTYNPEVLSQYLKEYFISSAQPKINNQINLCDSCTHTYPDCPAGEDDVLFGNGEGRDNICACRKYEVQGRQEIELDCDTCKHSEEPWDEPPCDGCCKGHSAYKPKEQVE